MTRKIIALIIFIAFSVSCTQLSAEQSADASNGLTREEAALLKQLLNQQMQNNLSSTEAKLERLNERVDDQAERLNERIDDALKNTSLSVDAMGNNLTWMSAFITALLVAFSFIGYFSFRELAKEKAESASEA